jgi:hypothetical protein
MVENEHRYEFESDNEFMKWLLRSTPNWECQYSGNLLQLYSAFQAGRSATSPIGAYEAIVISRSPAIHLATSEMSHVIANAANRAQLKHPAATMGDVARAIDAELVEVREVLDTTKRRSLPDGPCWCRTFMPTLGHTEDCQRTRAIYDKLKLT